MISVLLNILFIAFKLLPTRLFIFFNIYFEKKRNLEALNLTNVDYFIGYFQSYKYFENIEMELKKDFNLNHQKLESSNELYEKINNTNSICVHIRRGDYLYDNNLVLQDIDYFEKAISKIKKEIENPFFFIFSNDIEWCKTNFKNNENYYFVENVHNGYKSSNALNLMLHCKHFIISNSSFSWWAAWLCNNPNKIILAPKFWFKVNNLEAMEYLIPKNWVII